MRTNKEWLRGDTIAFYISSSGGASEAIGNQVKRKGELALGTFRMARKQPGKVQCLLCLSSTDREPLSVSRCAEGKVHQAQVSLETAGLHRNKQVSSLQDFSEPLVCLYIVNFQQKNRLSNFQR